VWGFPCMSLLQMQRHPSPIDPVTNVTPKPAESRTAPDRPESVTDVTNVTQETGKSNMATIAPIAVTNVTHHQSPMLLVVFRIEQIAALSWQIS
jgi:hypothetical protein